ncbi:MAG TPA: DUF4404 family protein [Pirellulales bacterium]|nr:DUF4404 family protein [Pirellulales bacterium]
MADDRDKLRDALDRLQKELEELRKLNPGVGAQLDETIDEARATLEGKSPDLKRHSTLIERLSNAMLDYEASHPSLAGNLGGLIDALANMGI